MELVLSNSICQESQVLVRSNSEMPGAARSLRCHFSIIAKKVFVKGPKCSFCDPSITAYHR